MSAREWPGAAHDLREELERDYPGVPIRFVVETNAGGEMAPELLRQEEKIRRLRAKKTGVSVIEVRGVAVKPSEPKARRAGPVAKLARDRQLFFLRGLATLRGQLLALADDAAKRVDRADAAVHGALDLAGLREDVEAQQRERKRDAYRGLGAPEPKPKT